MRYSGTMKQMLEQSRQPSRFPTHQELLDAGYKWDGMDGYTAPDVKDEPDAQRT